MGNISVSASFVIEQNLTTVVGSWESTACGYIVPHETNITLSINMTDGTIAILYLVVT